MKTQRRLVLGVVGVSLLVMACGVPSIEKTSRRIFPIGRSGNDDQQEGGSTVGNGAQPRPINLRTISPGGSMVVVCSRAGGAGLGSGVELLDSFEDRAMDGAQPSALMGGTEADIVERALATLSAKDDARLVRYRTEAAGFSSRIILTDEILGHAVEPRFPAVPEGCSLERVAARVDLKDSLGVQFVLRRSLWDGLSASGRAGVILHEIVHAEALARGHQDSRAARRLTSALLAGRIAAMDQVAYDAFLLELDLSPTALP